MNSIRLAQRFPVLILCFIIFTQIACGSLEEKREKYFKRGETYLSEEKYDEAVIEFKNVLQIDPEYAEGYYQLALTYLKLQQPRGAYGSLLKTIDLDPEHVSAHLAVGEILLLAKQTDQALEKAEFVLEKDPENIQAHQLKGNCLLVKGDLDGALHQARSLLEKEPDSVDTMIFMAQIHNLKKEGEKAEELLLKALNTDETNIKTYITLARHYQAYQQEGKIGRESCRERV